MNHSNQLAIVDGNEVFTIDEQTELEKHIDHVIAAHKNNRREMNRLVFECTSALTAADDASHELESKGFFSRLIGGITGSNKQLQDKINGNMKAAQYASQVTMQKLAEQNLMTVDLLTAVNNKLNASIDAVNEKFKEQFVTLGKFILKTRGDMISLSLRMDKVEWNVKLLNWQASVEYLKLNGVEYSDLDDTGKIVCLARDFYDLTGGNWTTSDLLLLKAAMGQIGMAPKKEMNIFDTLKTIADTPVLQEKLLNHHGIKPISDPSYLISMGTLEKLNALADKDRYVVDVMAANYKNHGVTMGADEIRGDLAKDYMRQQANVNLNTHVGAYDFLLDLLYNLSESTAEGLLQCKVEWVQKAAEQEDAHAQTELGTMYKNSTGVEPSDEKALKPYQKAAEQGDADAQYHLGFMYQYGRGVERSYEKAREWYLKAAEQGLAHAQYNLGRMYQYGRGVERSYEKAAEWFLKAAEQGFARAQYSLGCMYDKGAGVEQSDEKAVKWYQKAAKQGLARAQNNLGSMYKNGRGVERSYEKAVEWFLKAEEQGLADAQNNLGVMYKNGRGVEQSYKKAVEWFLKAAEQGNASAQNNLGVMYHNGTGVEQSDEKAVKWYQKAAKQGLARAQNNLGSMYKNGRGVERSYEKAVEWFLKAEEQGLADAQNNLGVMYKNGRGVEQSYKKAVEWFLKAAEQGNASAQNNLGVMYHNGTGVEQSYKKAVEWFQKAAKQGLASAQYDLGLMYEFGRGVEQSDEKAREWYQKAADQGFEDAMVALNSLNLFSW